MRILNCFKTTPDFDAVPETDWVSGASSGVFDFSYIKQDIDPYSESGLELVLRAKDAFLKESPADGAQLTALTFGPAVSEKALRTLAALGYDECVRIDGTPDPFQAEQTAAKIAAYCQAHGPFDLIVLGAQSPDGGNKKTPYLLAEYLGMPLLQQVTGFTFADLSGGDRTLPIEETGRVTVIHTAFGQTFEETVDLPLVLVIGDVPGTLLRVPTLRQRKEASGKEITVIAPEELPELSTEAGEEAVSSGQMPRVTCTGMEPVDSSRQGARIEGKDAAETAQILYDNFLRDVMEVRR